jgi:hypothetical protein
MAGKKKAAVASKARKPKQRDAVNKKLRFRSIPYFQCLIEIRAGELKLLILPIPLQVKKLGKKALILPIPLQVKKLLEFRSQLDSIGLKIVQVTADGNCFFRFWIIFLSWILFISTKEGEGDSALLLLWDVATGFQDFVHLNKRGVG